MPIWRGWPSSWRRDSGPWRGSTTGPWYLRHVGSIFILYFGFTEDVEDFRDWLTQADLASYTRFVAGCEEYGVRFTDRRGREYLSVAHTQEDIRRTLAVADQVLGEMERGER